MILNESTDAFFHAYFNHGHSYDVSLDVLSALHGINMSMQMLKEGTLVIV